MVKRSVDQKPRWRNFDAWNEKIETGAAVTSRRGLSSVERGQGNFHQWKTKERSLRGDKCSFRHDGDERAKPTPKTASPSEPPTQRGRSAPRNRNLRGRSPSWKFDRQPCRDYLKHVCTKSICDQRHPPECQFYKSESGCKFGDKCSFAHRQIEGQSSKKPKRMVTKVQWPCWKMHDNWVAYFRTQSRRNLYRLSRKSTNQFDEHDSQKLRSVMQTSEKTKVRRSKQFKSKFLISVVRTLWNLRIDLRRRLKDSSDVSAETRGDWPRISCSSKKRTKLPSSHLPTTGVFQRHLW